MGRNRRHEINEAEARLARHKLAVASRSARLSEALYAKLTEPAAFLIAGSVGYLIGEFSRPNVGTERPQRSSPPRQKPLETATFWLKTIVALLSWSRLMLAKSADQRQPAEQK